MGNEVFAAICDVREMYEAATMHITELLNKRLPTELRLPTEDLATSFILGTCLTQLQTALSHLERQLYRFDVSMESLWYFRGYSFGPGCHESIESILDRTIAEADNPAKHNKLRVELLEPFIEHCNMVRDRLEQLQISHAPGMNDLETEIFKVLENKKLTGEEIAIHLGPEYSYNSHMKSTLAGMVKRGLLLQHHPGYTCAFRKSGQSQD